MESVNHDGMPGHGDVVDERVGVGRELPGSDVGAGPGVVHVGLAGPTTGDPQAAVVIDLDADRRAAGVRRHERVALPGVHVALPDGARRDRADVHGRALDGDALRLPAGREGDGARMLVAMAPAVAVTAAMTGTCSRRARRDEGEPREQREDE